MEECLNAEDSRTPPYLNLLQDKRSRAIISCLILCAALECWACLRLLAQVFLQAFLARAFSVSTWARRRRILLSPYPPNPGRDAVHWRRLWANFACQNMLRRFCSDIRTRKMCILISAHGLSDLALLPSATALKKKGELRDVLRENGTSQGGFQGDTPCMVLLISAPPTIIAMHFPKAPPAVHIEDNLAHFSQ